MQLFGVVGGIVGAATSARWGHKQIMQHLQSYITVEEYRNKTGVLHTEINELRVRIAVLEDRQAAK